MYHLLMYGIKDIVCSWKSQKKFLYFCMASPGNIIATKHNNVVLFVNSQRKGKINYDFFLKSALW